MYEEYMQNFFNYPINGYRNTYDQSIDNYPYGYMEPNMMRNIGNNYNNFNMQNRSNMQNNELEDCYPEIYKIVYPMVKKVCTQNNRSINKDTINNMVDEVYNNIETNEIELNITLNNDVRGEKGDTEVKEDRQIRRNNGLNDIIRILILRELLGRPGCIGPNCRPGRPPFHQRPNQWHPGYSRYEFDGMW